MDSTQKLLEFAENIDINPLFDKIRSITGLSDLKFTHKIYERNGYVSIQFQSQDISDKIGFLKLIFSEINIEQFNSEVREKNENMFWWGTVDFRYKHPHGGSNGCTFLTFRYDERSGWEFDE